MQNVSRRHFLGGSLAAAGCLATPVQELRANPLGMPVGFQTWVVRDRIGADFPGAMREMAAMGYQTLELCSPPSYAGAGFAPLAKLSATEVRKVIEDAGLRCVSCHYGFKELKESLPERLSYAKDLGIKQMVLASFGMPKAAKLADWARAASELNKAGEQALKAGIQLGYHNHDMEFEQLEGTLIYDKLMSEFDPKLIKMQFQVSVISLGFEAVTYFEKYPGRFISLHLADWSPKEKQTVAVGQGIVDWKKLFHGAKKAGVQNYFAEIEGMPVMKTSCEFLRGLKA